MCRDVVQIRSVLLILAGLFRIIAGADQTSEETAKTAVHASCTPHRRTCHRSGCHRSIPSGRLHSHYTGIDPHYNLLLPRPHLRLSVSPTAPSMMHGNRKDGTPKENPFPLKIPSVVYTLFKFKKQSSGQDQPPLVLYISDDVSNSFRPCCN